MFKPKRKVLFYQHFGKKGVIRGAHHKTFDFFHHIKSFSDFEPYIFFDEDSIWDADIPWFHLYERMPTLRDLNFEPDILFLNSGKDWIKYSQQRPIKSDTPIVSPVNNFRATGPGHKSFDFLGHKAIRICPSPEIFDVVKNHPNTVGETVYMPNGVGITDQALEYKDNKSTDVLIVGNKNPEMARALYQEIKTINKSIDVIDEWISKEEFQLKLAKSKLSIHLPKVVEEHYIPGIEAMMLNSLVIIPDCIGNRSYSINQKSCVISPYDLISFKSILQIVLSKSNKEINDIIRYAEEFSLQYSMNIEGQSLYKALKLTEVLWD